MQINKQDLEKSQIELEVTLNSDEFKPYLEKGAQKVSEQIKIEGFRPGKAPYEIIKQKVGEMTILEEAANIAVRLTIDQAIKDNLGDKIPVGQPQVEINKLAPDNDFIYKIKIMVLPTVKLGEYKNLKIKSEEVKVSADELEKTLGQLQEMKVKEAAKAESAVKGDKLIVDIAMFLAGVPIDGGQAKDAQVILGKDYFLPGFDQNLIGVKKGDVKEFSLDYPKEHHQKNLAGKKVDFKVTVKELFDRQVPELNDQLAQDLQFKDLGELKEAVKKNIITEKTQKQELKTEKEMLEALIKNSQFDDLPDQLVNSEAQSMLLEMERSIQSQGGKFEDYLQHLKKTKEQLLLDFAPDAIKRIKIALLLRQVADQEKMIVTEEEINQRLTELKKTYAGQTEALKNLDSLDYKRHLANALLSDKIIKQLKDWNYADSGQK